MVAFHRDDNRIPVIGGVSSLDNVTPKEATIDSSTGGLDVNIVGGSSSGTQYTDGGAAATHPVGTGIIFNNSGTYTFVSAANPLPISGSITASNPSVSATGSATPSSATLLGASDGTDLQALQVDASKNLKVLVENSSLAVTGTFWQATQPISAASLPLPTGAATSAKQPALGTAGSASGDVLTVQGIASMTALKVDGSAVTQPVSGTVTASNTTGNVASGSADSGNPVKAGGIFNATLPTFVDGNRGDLQLGSRGAMRMALFQDGSTNTAIFDADNADGASASATQRNFKVQSRNTVFNGTTWDRQYGDATNGTWVNVKNTVAIPAGTNLIGQVSASNETSTVYNGTTALTPSFATISTSTSGASSLVAAVASHKIRVLALSLMANGTVNVKFQSHTTPTDETGLYYLVANTGFVLPYNPVGWFQTNSGEQLDINLSAAIAVGGCLVYIAV